MAKTKPAVVDPAHPTAAELRRWQAGHRQVGERQRALIAKRPFDGRRSIELSLDLLDAGLPANHRRRPADAARQRDVDAVRAIWRRLRARFVKYAP